MKNGCRVMVPQVRYDDEPVEQRAWHNAEVSDLHGNPRKYAMREAVELVQEREYESLGSPNTLGENDRASLTCGHLGNQSRHVGRVVLAIGIHHNHRIARNPFLHVRETDGERALMAEVSSERQHADLRDRVQLVFEQTLGPRLERRIVDQY